MIRINRQTDYAIRVLLSLARETQAGRSASARIGEQMLIPKAFLSRIIARLAQADLLHTFSGRDGGVQLARSPEQITLAEVLETMEGPFLLSDCMTGEDACPFENGCPVRKRWGRLQTVLVEELKRTTFAELAAESDHDPGPGAILPLTR